MKTKQGLKRNSAILIILIIHIVLCGCILDGRGLSPPEVTKETPGIQNSPKIDAWCEIQEFNLTIIQNQTRVPVNDEDLRPYPEFAMYLHNVNDDPHAWKFGTRLVKDFDCNASRTIQFLKLYRKYEETPFQPVLEYQGHDYKIGFEYFNAHQTYVPQNSDSDQTQTLVDDPNSAAIGIALNNNTIRSYLSQGYTIVSAAPATVGINERKLSVTAVQFDTPQDMVGVNVDVQNGSIVNIWTLPKRSPP